MLLLLTYHLLFFLGDGCGFACFCFCFCFASDTPKKQLSLQFQRFICPFAVPKPLSSKSFSFFHLSLWSFLFLLVFLSSSYDVSSSSNYYSSVFLIFCSFLLSSSLYFLCTLPIPVQTSLICWVLASLSFVVCLLFFDDFLFWFLFGSGFACSCCWCCFGTKFVFDLVYFVFSFVSLGGLRATSSGPKPSLVASIFGFVCWFVCVLFFLLFFLGGFGSGEVARRAASLGPKPSSFVC